MTMKEMTVCFCSQVRTIEFVLPPTIPGVVKEMLEVTDDGKLRVRSPLHEQLEGLRVKALDRVTAVNSNGGDPQALLQACVNEGPADIKLQRGHNLWRVT